MREIDPTSLIEAPAGPRPAARVGPAHPRAAPDAPRAAAAGGAQPFPRAAPRGPHVAADPAGQEAPAPAAGALPAVAAAADLPAEPPVRGVERRLVRRAEALWEALLADRAPPARAGGGAARAVPDAGQVQRFLVPPFGAQAVLLAFPPHPADPDSDLPRIVEAGEAVRALGLCLRGTVVPDGRTEAPAADQLAMLAARAVALGEPVRFERDALALPQPPGEVPPGPGEGLQSLLLRAIALPFAARPGCGPQAVVILSWRKLLSEAEALRLSEELRAAVAALQRAGPA